MTRSNEPQILEILRQSEGGLPVKGSAYNFLHRDHTALNHRLHLILLDLNQIAQRDIGNPGLSSLQCHRHVGVP
jgi:hypothetical protein